MVNWPTAVNRNNRQKAHSYAVRRKGSDEIYQGRWGPDKAMSPLLAHAQPETPPAMASDSLSSQGTTVWLLEAAALGPETLGALSVFAIESNARARERAVMREYAQGVAAALDRSGSGFASYLRAGAALFSSLEDVSPETFDNFVRALKLNTEYSGAEGIGWIPVMEARDMPAFLARARASQPAYPDIFPAPASGTGRIAPVAMFAPATALNRRAPSPSGAPRAPRSPGGWRTGRAAPRRTAGS